MIKEELYHRIIKLNKLYLKDDPQTLHAKIDKLLLEYIDDYRIDEEVKKCWRAINK